ncbi:MAG TPA: serine/threonine-protein kinase, partial [Polyangiaceae bacterium]
MGSDGCIEVGELAAFASRELSAVRLRHVEDHLGTCADCRAALHAVLPTELPARNSGPEPPSTRGTDAPLATGMTIGRFIVGRLIGAGGMGVVYSARDPGLNRDVAIKLLRRRSGTDAREMLEGRLRREAHAMARLSHPNVLPIFEVGIHGDRLFVAMEYVAGGTLREWLALEERGTPAIIDAFIKAGSGLAAAHAAGIVHRDFKPDNVLVGEDGQIRVTDFGLARLDGAPEDANAASLSASGERPPNDAITHTGMVLGTPAYMSPEQLRGEAPDARADQFSFCVALMEALTGKRPFASDVPGAWRAELAHGAAPDGVDSLPRWLRRPLLRGLSARASDRFPEMARLLAVLRAGPPTSRLRRLAQAGTAVALSVLAIAAVHKVTAQRTPVCPSAAPELASAWDDARKSEVQAAFRATGKAYAEDAFRGVANVLDAYAASWVGMRGEACVATRVRGVQSDELLDLRMTCLSRRLAELRALSSEFAHAEAETVEHGMQAAQALDPISQCADVAMLRARVRPPADPVVRARMDGVRAKLDQARVVGYSARPEEGVAMAKTAAAEAMAIGYRPLEAEALGVEGDLLLRTGAPAEAGTALERAAIAAEAGHDGAAETKAWILLTHADADSRRDEDGKLAAGHAHACLERDGANDEELARLLLEEGSLARNAEHFEEARDLAKSALAIWERIAPESLDAAACHEDLSDIALRLGSIDEALSSAKRALAIHEKAVGPEHPLVATSLNSVANALLWKEDFVGAIATYRRV